MLKHDSAASIEEPLLSDLALAIRLEETEAVANARFVDARRRLSPSSAAEWIEVAGARVMFDGPASPCTQTFGLGVLGEPTEADFEKIEEFYQLRGAPVFHEISPLVSSNVLNILNTRGYQPIEFTNVLCRRIGNEIATPCSNNPKVSVAIALPEQLEMWAQTSAAGWGESLDLRAFILDLARHYAVTENCSPMFAFENDRPIATGVLSLVGSVALLAGASTIPEARKRGAQSALLEHRLRHAINQGCDLAMICALPGSPSQRNAQRNGFQVAYTRAKWQLVAR